MKCILELISWNSLDPINIRKGGIREYMRKGNCVEGYGPNIPIVGRHFLLVIKNPNNIDHNRFIPFNSSTITKVIPLGEDFRFETISGSVYEVTII